MYIKKYIQCTIIVHIQYSCISNHHQKQKQDLPVDLFDDSDMVRSRRRSPSILQKCAIISYSLIIFQMCKTRMEKKLKSFDPVLCEQMTAELLIPVKNTEINPRNQILKMCFMLNLTFQHSRVQ